MNSSPFRSLSRTRMVLSHTFTTSISRSIPAILPSRILLLHICFPSTVTWSLKVISLSPELHGASVSHLRVIKRMYESRLGRNLQNVPCGQEKVCLSAERDITASPFISTNTSSQNTENSLRHNSRLALQPSDLFSLNRNQYGCCISYSGQPAPVHQTLAAVFGECFFVYFDGPAVKRSWQCLPSLTNGEHLRVGSSAPEKTRSSTVIFCGSTRPTTWHSVNKCLCFILNEAQP